MKNKEDAIAQAIDALEAAQLASFHGIGAHLTRACRALEGLATDADLPLCECADLEGDHAERVEAFTSLQSLAAIALNHLHRGEIPDTEELFEVAEYAEAVGVNEHGA